MSRNSIAVTIQQAIEGASRPERKFEKKQQRAFKAAGKLIEKLTELKKAAPDLKFDFEIEKPGTRDGYINIKTNIREFTGNLNIRVYPGFGGVFSAATKSGEQISYLRAQSPRTVKKTVAFIARQAAKQQQ